MALKDVLGELLDLDGLVHSVHKTLAGEPITVILAGLVETPVLWYAEECVVVTLPAQVSLGGALGRNLEDEVRRLALLGDDVPVALYV